MTKQTLLLLLGATAFGVAKFYYKRDNLTCALAATSTITVVSLFTAKNTDDK